MEVQFTLEQESRLARLAAQSGTDAKQLVTDVVSRYLDEESRFLAAVEKGLAAAARGREVAVVDLPRSIGEPARIALAASDLVLIVVPAEIRAAAAAARVATEVMRFADDVQIVVRYHQRHPALPHMLRQQSRQER